ncbi:P-type DNA transfer ATPase VirB11 [Paucibacter sp. XJ19-41]|uniref:P-type DNA transfer ATPase VirB11 n=1 Tax=Paucibacter sp. XJ19-41 TaxID=2927824 RepID=UPI00234B878C|nr:P-type DNA transfer ATPase VirB11 [Paucibacter sp. XJ19-41]MDC6166592.1 P-type DNA transfer ATPase VirB11 [Paucibacter sp. XJ19-41]
MSTLPAHPAPADAVTAPRASPFADNSAVAASPDAAWAGDATSVIEFLRPLRALLDEPGVLEVCVNAPGWAMVEDGAGWRRCELPTLSLERCLSLAMAVATYTDQQVSQEHPLLAATLPSGERIQFVIPPAVTRGTVSITMRRPSTLLRPLPALAIDGLFDRLGCGARPKASQPYERELQSLLQAGRLVEFLQLAVRQRQTIVVSGKTGSGKTTFLKALIEEVPVQERLITIEDTAELPMPHHPNTVHLFYSKGSQGVARVSAKSLLEACLRMRPDRILLAELRGEECFDFVRLAASAHPGFTSVHAGSCALAIEQMALMIRESNGGGGGMTLDEIRHLLRQVVDVVVQFDRDERGRFVSEISYEPRTRRIELAPANGELFP